MALVLVKPSSILGGKKFMGVPAQEKEGRLGGLLVGSGLVAHREQMVVYLGQSVLDSPYQFVFSERAQ